MMTRKHFQAIAAIIRREHEKLDQQPRYCARDMLNTIGNKIANVCEQENPNFDRERFAKACSSD